MKIKNCYDYKIFFLYKDFPQNKNQLLQKKNLKTFVIYFVI